MTRALSTRVARRPLPLAGRGRAAFCSRRGFSLVELMTAVAIIGVLAALAIYGVSRYMATSKSSDAKEKIRLISEHAVAAFVRDRSRDVSMVLPGAFTQKKTHLLCGSASWVPDTIAKVKGVKYQPITDPNGNADFETGDWTAGWRCLRFHVSEPIMYRLNYAHNAGDWSGLLAGQEYFVVQAEGDVDGDGVVSRFQRGGTVVGDDLNLLTELWVENPTE